MIAMTIMAVALLLVRLSGPGPLFYWQVREGRFGRPFSVPKIRTMVPDADQLLQEHFEQNAALRAEWEAGYKLRSDPRLIPGLGRWLRRFSIDELPQLWSVVKGEMSLVGPRPFPHYHLQAISARSLDTPITMTVRSGKYDLASDKLTDGVFVGTTGTFTIAPAEAGGTIVYWVLPGGGSAVSHLKGFNVGDETVKDVLDPSKIPGSQCIGCHTVAGTTAVGVTGPNLTHLRSRGFIAGGVLANTPENLSAWVTNAPGFKPGTVMPSFADVFTPEQVNDLVAYLTTLQ